MAIRERLNHVAAGMADSFISRNNDLFGHWAPGLMYREVQDAACLAMLDLVTGTVAPAAPYCTQVGRNYAAFMHAALKKMKVPAEALLHATIQVRFGAAGKADGVASHWCGDRFEVRVTLRAYGREGSAIRSSHCQPFRAGRYSCRAGGTGLPG